MSSTGSRLPACSLRPPGRHGEDVVAGLGLRLGGDGQQQLVALRGDEVDRDFDLFLLRPFLDERFRRLVRAGHPVIPEADRELAGRMAPRTNGAAIRASTPPPCRQTYGVSFYFWPSDFLQLG